MFCPFLCDWLNLTDNIIIKWSVMDEEYRLRRRRTIQKSSSVPLHIFEICNFICTWFLQNQVQQIGFIAWKKSISQLTKIQFVELDFSKLIFQKSSTDQQGDWVRSWMCCCDKYHLFQSKNDSLQNILSITQREWIEEWLQWLPPCILLQNMQRCNWSDAYKFYYILPHTVPESFVSSNESS